MFSWIVGGRLRFEDNDMLLRKWDKDQEEDAKRYICQSVSAARLGQDLSQGDLAHRINRPVDSISDVEQGRSNISASDLAGIAYVLDKPVSWFFPQSVRGADAEGLSPDERELVRFFRMLRHSALRWAVLTQVKALADAALEEELEEQDWDIDDGMRPSD